MYTFLYVCSMTVWSMYAAPPPHTYERYKALGGRVSQRWLTATRNGKGHLHQLT